jgi:hypothetical protein
MFYPLMTDAEALEKLGAILPVLSDGWKQAHSIIRETHGHPYYDQRSKAVALQIETVRLVRDILERDHGAIYTTVHSQHIFTIPGVAHIVFKKLDESLKISPGKTSHADTFYSQGTLDGLQDIPRLVSGAVPSRDGTGLVGVYLTYPKSRGRANNWVLNITDQARPLDIDQNRMPFMAEDDVAIRKNPYRPKHGRKQTDAGDAAADGS